MEVTDNGVDGGAGEPGWRRRHGRGPVAELQRHGCQRPDDERDDEDPRDLRGASSGGHRLDRRGLRFPTITWPSLSSGPHVEVSGLLPGFRAHRPAPGRTGRLAPATTATHHRPRTEVTGQLDRVPAGERTGWRQRQERPAPTGPPLLRAGRWPPGPPGVSRLERGHEDRVDHVDHAVGRGDVEELLLHHDPAVPPEVVKIVPVWFTAMDWPRTVLRVRI